MLAVVATCSTGLVATWIYRAIRKPADSVVLVDNRRAVAELLELRNRDVAPDPRPIAVDSGEPSPLVREVIPFDVARLFFPLSGLGRPYNEKFFFARPPNVGWSSEWPEHPNGAYDLKTNSLGIREDEEPALMKPDLRIIVTGDSHTDGVCSNSESFPNRLELLLQALDPKRKVEVLNMGIGGYTFWNYLGVLEHYAPILHPDVFVVACYGGNDFYEALGLHRYFTKRKGGSIARIPEALLKAQNTGFVSQELLQVGHILSNPEDEAIAIDVVNAITREMQRVALANQVKLVAVYIPPPSIGQPEHAESELAELLALTDWTREDLEIGNRLADGWISWLERHDIPCLDLRSLFRATPEPLYWRADRHINLRANDLIAAQLSKLVDPATK